MDEPLPTDAPAVSPLWMVSQAARPGERKRARRPLERAMMRRMHHSRFAGFIIDCRDTPPDDAARFWSAALGWRALGDDGHGYSELDAGVRDLHVEVQNVTHESRVHLDLETDDVEAEVRRLEALGARRHHDGPRWVVMEAPTGQRFCVVRARGPLAGAPGVTRWP